MSNKGKPEFKLPPQNGNQPRAQSLVITLNHKGEVTVAGPIADKILCYGLLEIGRQLVQQYEAPAQGNGIIPLPPGTSIQ
jgi:hypothetical protein